MLSSITFLGNEIPLEAKHSTFSNDYYIAL